MMLPSRLGCLLSLKTPNMGNTGQLVFNALSPDWPVPEDDKGGQESWFTVRIASLIE